MSIKCDPLTQPFDEKSLISKFEKFGECSVDIKSDAIYINFLHPHQAIQAFEALNCKDFHSFAFSLTLLSQNSKNKDIEITIPPSQVTFALTGHETPSASPFFPDAASQMESPVYSPQPLDGRSESPISVRSIPISNVWNFSNESQRTEEIIEKLPIKRKFETVSLVIPKKQEPNDMHFCITCKRSIKKKSIKVHNSSKVHQSNLK